MISVEHAAFSYETGQSVFQDLSFVIRDGEAVGLIGANGAGKSTLMKLLLGLQSGSGRILVDGCEVRQENLKEIRRKLGYVLQNSDQQMFMPTVLDDILFGPLNYGMSRSEAERKADEILKMLGIEELKGRRNHRISGGEKRMAAIAAVLAMDPDVLLMDEPTSALDPYSRRKIINVIRALPKTRLIASHDLDLILDTCDRVILLGRNGIAADGETRAILSDRMLLEENRMELPLSLQGRG